jgi:hypothetical protein
VLVGHVANLRQGYEVTVVNFWCGRASYVVYSWQCILHCVLEVSADGNSMVQVRKQGTLGRCLIEQLACRER